MIASAIFVFASCDSKKHPSKLVGKWEASRMIYISEGNGKVSTLGNPIPDGFPKGEIEFLKDGTAVINGKVTTWEVSEYHLFIDNKAYEYSGGADGLTLSDGDKSADYHKNKSN
ncbi:hypothetical protein FACS1894201_01190 [Bacteroidia bacterium]|nr:hypothetical protein FACS1894201_01190 [Bacteroidia bacterium]